MHAPCPLNSHLQKGIITEKREREGGKTYENGRRMKR
jgi:hypothetical protein